MWFFLRLKYLMCFFRASVQLGLRFYSHLSCSLLQLQLILLQIPHLQLTAFNSYPNIYQKWNWAENNLQIFCLKLLNLKKMGAKEEISLMELFLKDSHIMHWSMMYLTSVFEWMPKKKKFQYGRVYRQVYPQKRMNMKILSFADQARNPFKNKVNTLRRSTQSSTY